MTQPKRVVRRRPGSLPGHSTAVHRQTTGPTVWIFLVLILLAVLPYLQTFGHDFVNFDDSAYVAENPMVQQGLSWSNVAWAFTTFQAGNWHPLTWLSHMLDCQFFGIRPGWHHLVNVLLHAANTLLVFAVLRGLTGAVWRSALVAALFAAHPLHVESVAWIAERKDVLSTFFGLCALLAYGRYTQKPTAGRYGIVLCLFVMSIMAKPMLVTFPFVLLLVDVWPLQRFWKPDGTLKPKLTSLFLEKLPMLLISVISSVVTFNAQHAAGAVAPIAILSLSQRLANAITAYAGYIGQLFWPVGLAAIYPLREEISAIHLTVAFLVLAGITTGVILLGRERRWLIVGWFWFIGTLVPVIGLVQVGDQSMADRYTYFPYLGLFIMIAWSIPAIALAATGRRQVVVASVALVLVALGVVTFQQVKVWKNTGTLFEHAINVTERNYVAHNLYAGALGAQGDLPGARAHIEKALQFRQDYAGAHYNLGLVLLRERDFVRAHEQFDLALKTLPTDPMIWNGLGVANINLGRTDEAIANYRKALELNPYYADAMTDLGAAFLQEKKFAEAVEMSEKALKLRPGVAETYATIGAALWNLGRADESIMNNRKAVELNPNLVSARLNLSLALLAKGQYDEAMSNAEQALRLDPQNEVAQRVLSVAQQKRSAPLSQP